MKSVVSSNQVLKTIQVRPRYEARKNDINGQRPSGSSFLYFHSERRNQSGVKMPQRFELLYILRLSEHEILMEIKNRLIYLPERV